MAGERTARNSRLPVELLKLLALFSKQGVDRTFLYRHRDLLGQIHALQAGPPGAGTRPGRHPGIPAS